MSGVGDDLRGAAERAARLLDGRTLACAESCTAGLVTQAFAAVEGSGDWLRGGVVAYQREAKADLLDVDPSAPLVSSTVAEQMARGVAARMDADVTVATTGAAGPTGLDGVRPGTVVLAVWIEGAADSVEVCYGGPDPAAIVELASHDAVAMLTDALLQHGGGSRREAAGTATRIAGESTPRR